MSPIQFSNFSGRIGQDYERVSRVYRRANGQQSWAARMTAYVVGIVILLLALLILVPLVILVMLLFGVLVLVGRVRMAISRMLGGSGQPGSGGVVARRASSGRKNVRVRERLDD